MSLWQGRISQREGWLLFIVPLQLRMKSAGEVPYDRVIPSASSLYRNVFWLLRLDKELVKPESLMALFEGCVLHVKWEDSWLVYFQTHLLKAVFPEMQKHSGILARCLGTDSETMGREGPL